VPSEVEFPLPGSLTVLPLTLQALGGSHLAREVPTLQLMYEHCAQPENEDGWVFYLHSKVCVLGSGFMCLFDSGFIGIGFGFRVFMHTGFMCMLMCI